MEPHIAEITEWLVAPENRCLPLETLVEGLADRLVAAGIALTYVSTSARTMHPEVFVHNLRWSPKSGTNKRVQPHNIVGSQQYEDSPVRLIHGGQSQVRCRLDRPLEELRFEICRELASAGATDYVIYSLPFRSGASSYVSYATDAPKGFSETDLALLAGVVAPFSLRLDLESTAHATEALLTTYLGANAAGRVMNGSFRRGQGEPISAIIWMCDLRGFTRMVNSEPREDVLATLDTYFESVAEPIMDNGGEVLKFIGDAVLAIFPLEPSDREAAVGALGAATEAFRRIGSINADRSRAGRGELAFGLALHVGEVMYGNIGARGRLDFTVIGPAVNEASRVESMCKSLGVSLLMTSAFAQLVDEAQLESLGKHDLRGVDRAVELFTAPKAARDRGA